jgi:copper chaperone CopZ
MKKKIVIEGMSCGHCVNHVKAALIELKGAIGVDVSLTDKIAVFEASTDVADDEIKAAIDEAGYEVLAIETL